MPNDMLKITCGCCAGSGKYTPLTGPVEPCGTCKGEGVVDAPHPAPFGNGPTPGNHESRMDRYDAEQAQIAGWTINGGHPVNIMRQPDGKVAVDTETDEGFRQGIKYVNGLHGPTLASIPTKPAEYAHQMQKMMYCEPTMTIQELANRIGRSPGWINNTLSLTQLSPDAQPLIDNGEICLSNAYALAKLPTVMEQNNFIDRAKVMAPAEFAPLVRSRLRQIKADRRRAMGVQTERTDFDENEWPYKECIPEYVEAYREGRITHGLMILASRLNESDQLANFNNVLAASLILQPLQQLAEKRKGEQFATLYGAGPNPQNISRQSECRVHRKGEVMVKIEVDDTKVRELLEQKRATMEQFYNRELGEAFGRQLDDAMGINKTNAELAS